MKDGEEEDEEEEMDLGSCEMKEEGFELTLPSGKLAELSYPLGKGKAFKINKDCFELMLPSGDNIGIVLQ